MSQRSDPARTPGPPGDTPRTAAELFVDCLENEGVEFVFGIPGEETLDLSEALDRSQLITFVPTRHEQGAAFMADAYGRLTGRPGVCLATLGPGASNLATGIGDATLDNAPLVALTGQTGLAGMHKETTHQFIDTVDMLEPMTKWNTRVHHPRMVPEAVRKAFSIAAAEKPGATHLELPEDVMGTPVVGSPLPRGPVAMIEADPVSLLRAAEIIQGARQPVILAGNGVVRQEAAPALRAFCEETGLHVITTFMGKGVLDASDPHFLFTAGLRRQDYPQGLLGRADLVIAVGYDMIEWPPSAWNPEGRQRIVCIDTVAPEIDANFVPEVELIGDLSRILFQLTGLLDGKKVARLETRPYRAAFDRVLHAGTDEDYPIKPQRVLRDLREVLAPEDVLVSDVGAHKLWVARFWEAREPNTVLISNGFAAMGFGVPASIAAALARRGRSKVVCITGDGGFLMNVQELETARRLGLPFVVVVWSDGGYGLIEMHQRRKFGRIAGTRFDNPDLVTLARSFGVLGLRAEKAGDVKPLLARALRHPGPVVLDVPIDYGENDKLAVDLWQLAPEALP
jgi:acetolactate synthase-1/2/3 large subunit